MIRYRRFVLWKEDEIRTFNEKTPTIQALVSLTRARISWVHKDDRRSWGVFAWRARQANVR